MSKLTFAERAWEEYLYWQENDKKTLKRVNLLLKDIARNGNDGIGSFRLGFRQVAHRHKHAFGYVLAIVAA